MDSLKLREAFDAAMGPSEADVRESYVRAMRAVRLLANEDFVAWRQVIEGDKAKLVRALIERTESEQDTARKRGMIVAIEKLFAGLEIQAGNLEEASRRLEEYDRAKSEPVHQWWSLRGNSGR